MQIPCDTPASPSALELEFASALGSLLFFIGQVFHSFPILLDDKRSTTLDQSIRLLPAWQKLLAEFLEKKEVATFCENIQKLQNSSTMRTHAVKEFHRLFMAPEPLVLLWESTWVSKEKILFTEETTQVRRWYRRFNFVITQNGLEAEDHLGLEIAFCALLYEDALKQARQQKKETPDFTNLYMFCLEHPRKWVESCLGQLYSVATTSFWKTFLQVTTALLNQLFYEAEKHTDHLLIEKMNSIP